MVKNIITGGPGCGKTTILNLLAEKGYKVIPEAAREVIKEHGRHVLDLQELIFKKQLELEQTILGDYLDRSIVDGIAYSRHYGQTPSEQLLQAHTKAGYSQVFLLEPLAKEHYQNDTERTESYEQAVAIYESLKLTYAELGYTIVSLPATTPQDRLEKILQAREEETELKLHGVPKDVSQLHYLQIDLEENYVKHDVSPNGQSLTRVRKVVTHIEDRVHEPQYLFTQKFGSGIKRKELETRITQEQAKNLIAQHNLDIAYHKTRQVYVHPDHLQTRIYFDEIPSLGKFTEIEGVDVQRIIAVMGRLANFPIARKSYAQMATDAQLRHA
jgi:predicted ATPase/adenylate cyclase class IV